MLIAAGPAGAARILGDRGRFLAAAFRGVRDRVRTTAAGALIVRTALFGVDSAEHMVTAVREHWLLDALSGAVGALSSDGSRAVVREIGVVAARLTAIDALDVLVAG